MSDEIGQHERLRRQAASRVRSPAIAIVVVAAMGMCSAVLLLVLTAPSISGDLFERAADPRMQVGNVLFGLMTAGTVLLGMVAPLFLFHGAAKMKSLSSYPAARAAAFVVMVPIVSLCFPFGIPVGIWALSVLRDEHVKRAFARMASPTTVRPHSGGRADAEAE